MPNGHFSAGKNSRAQVAGTNCTFTEWTFKYLTEKIDTTNFESTGTHPSGAGTATFIQSTFGCLGATWSCKALWDSQQNRFDSPPGIYPRDDLGTVKLYPDLGRNYFHNIGQSLVISAETGARVRQDVSFSCDAEANGAFSNATGSS